MDIEVEYTVKTLNVNTDDRARLERTKDRIRKAVERVLKEEGLKNVVVEVE